MSKKNKFLFFSLLLTLFLTLAPVLNSYGVYLIIAFSLLSLLVSLICLWWPLQGLQFITLLTLPTLFGLGMISLLFSFPNFSFYFRLVFYAIFFVFFYSLLLALNVFNIASERPIPLLRAAYTVSFIITIFSSLPLFTILYKSYAGLTLEVLFVFLISFLLSFQSLWTVFLPQGNDASALRSSLLVSFLMGETALVFSFFPLESFFRSLTLATLFYIFLGFAHQHLQRRLTAKSVVEYGLVGLTIVLLVLLY